MVPVGIGLVGMLEADLLDNHLAGKLEAVHIGLVGKLVGRLVGKQEAVVGTAQVGIAGTLLNDRELLRW